ncbi:Crp/Fnr family transcriptional regulator [Ramlibacter sp.]|uniref:Crp/Fnr family transcriptional regulator n=1 Tax=Ramlibacter sp. TaxID=1917967 RepID=UPI0026026C7C|nr:Crp/Fnr family transcriptional regulator [Ramlibacter sp.]
MREANFKMKASTSPDFPVALRAHTTRATHATGTTIFRTGGPAHSVFYVESGAVRLVRFGRAGEEVMLHAATEGEFFAEASFDSPRYHCHAVTSGPSVLLQVPGTVVRNMLESDPEFARQWVALLAGRLRAARFRVERLSLKSATERVRHLLVSEGRGPSFELVLPGTLKDLARNLGLTHEVLYRTLAAMEREGAIERGQGVLRLNE